MKRGKPPTAEQKRWHDWLAEQGDYMALDSVVELHHPVGSTGKHNKVEIGQWWVIPLGYTSHRSPTGLHGDCSVFHGYRLGETRKEIEKAIFSRLVAHYHHQHKCLPCPADVIKAIQDYHR